MQPRLKKIKVLFSLSDDQVITDYSVLQVLLVAQGAQLTKFLGLFRNLLKANEVIKIFLFNKVLLEYAEDIEENIFWHGHLRLIRKTR